MPRIALVTAAEALSLDEDLPPLIAAFEGDAVAVCWDDATVDWSAFDLALLRSAWDYVPRLAEFLAWCDRVATVTRLLNPPALVRLVARTLEKDPEHRHPSADELALEIGRALSKVDGPTWRRWLT